MSGEQGQEISSLKMTHLKALSLLELTHLPLSRNTDLLSSEKTIKLKWIQQMITLRQNRMKANSAQLNYRIIGGNLSKSQEESERQSVLELLARQLHKKTFLSALQYSFLHRKCQQIEQIEMANSKKQLQSPESLQPKGLPTRVILFMQGLSALFNKQIYLHFQKIQHASKPKVERYTPVDSLVQLPPSHIDTIREYFQKWKMHHEGILANWGIAHVLDEDQTENIFDSSHASLHSSETKGDLKREKKLLKKTIRVIEGRLFLSSLNDMHSMQRINDICKSLASQNLLKKAFHSLCFYVQTNRSQAARRERYFQETAQNQLEDDSASKLFHNTSLLCSYFAAWQHHSKSLLSLRLLHRLMLRVALRRIEQTAKSQRKREDMAERRDYLRKMQLIFRSFTAWKTECGFTTDSLSKATHFAKQREMHRKAICFSLLSAMQKQGIIKERRAQVWATSLIQGKILSGWKIVTNISSVLQKKTVHLKDWLEVKAAHHFFLRLYSSYEQTLSNQRLHVRCLRLSETRTRKEAQRRLAQWQRKHSREKVYGAIQFRMLAMRDRQKKRQVLGIWRERLIENHERQNQNSGGHRQWLVKYYGDLCSLIDY